jgi:hypothetical protein
MNSPSSINNVKSSSPLHNIGALHLGINSEKVLIFIVIAAMISMSAASHVALGDPITREEAIERSKDSELVKEGLALAHASSSEANYYNSSTLEHLRKWHSDELFENVSREDFWEERVPRGHTAWEIIWGFMGVNGPSAQGYVVIVIVDAERGWIIFETLGSQYLQLATI